MFELLIIATGLAMDAFAVSICKGLNMRKLDIKQMGLIALFFGGFQAGMPLIGWFIGSQFAQYVASVDHWITFILLGIIGGKMIKESFEKEDGCCCQESKLNLKELTALAIATSIDALAVGVTFAFEYERNNEPDSHNQNYSNRFDRYHHRLTLCNRRVHRSQIRR